MSNIILPDDEGKGNGISRRKFLMGSGAAVGAAALFGASGFTPGKLLGVQLAAAQSLNSDMDILMFALTLEHLEDAAYRAANGSGLLSGKVADYFKTFGDQEHQHVVAITDTINKLGGTPVAEQASYNFPNFASQDDLVKFFAQVEEVGAGAYLGAAPLIKDPGILAAAASIHDVEGMHASVLRAVMNDPAPSPAFAAPLPVSDVLAAVTPLLGTPSGGTGTGGTVGMPRTGSPSSFPGPLFVAAGLGAAAVGALLKVRARGDAEATENAGTKEK